MQTYQNNLDTNECSFELKRNSTEEDENQFLYGNLGKLFMGLLKFYIEFNYDTYGISNIGEGQLFLKTFNTDIEFSSSMIWVEDFTDKAVNISRGTRQFASVLIYFQKVYFTLQEQKPESMGKNFVEQIANLKF